MWPSAAWIIQSCSVSSWLLLAFRMAREGVGVEGVGWLISLTGLTQGDQLWIETHITHTHHHTTREISGGASLLTHPAVCVHLTHPCCCRAAQSAYWEENNKGPSRRVHAKHSVCVCVWLILLCKHTWLHASILLLFIKNSAKQKNER